MIEPPPPGVYEDIPFADYLAWPYLSNSALVSAAKSMAHFNARLPVEETDAMRFGSLCHAGTLEPLSIAQRYVVMPAYEKQVKRQDGTDYEVPKATKEYKKLSADFERANADRTIVTAAEFADMQRLVRNLCTHERASECFHGHDAVFELVLVWDDHDTRLRCKARVDCRKPGRISDLKTCSDPLGFDRCILARGYHRQAAMYLDAVAELTGEICEYWLVVAESNAPFCVRAAPLDHDDIELGREQYKDLLHQIRDCQISEHWPAYTDPHAWKIPDNQKNEELELVFAGQSITL